MADKCKSLPIIQAALQSHGETVDDVLEAWGIRRNDQRWPAQMSVATACLYLDCCKTTLYTMMDRYDLKYRYSGRKRYLRKSDLDLYLDKSEWFTGPADPNRG